MFTDACFTLKLSAIWFRYDLSPITVKYVERRKPLYHFITTVRRLHFNYDCIAIFLIWYLKCPVVSIALSRRFELL